MMLANDAETMNRLQMHAMSGNDLGNNFEPNFNSLSAYTLTVLIASLALRTLELIQSAGGDLSGERNAKRVTSPQQEVMFNHQAQQQTMQPNSVEASTEGTSAQMNSSAGQCTSLTSSSREALCFSDELLEHSTNAENATTQLSINLPNDGLDSYEVSYLYFNRHLLKK